jgi:hypothetical protein
VVAGALDENRHLVRHLADVGLGRGQHGQAGALAGRRHDEEARRHLDDRLARLTAEVPAGTAGKRVEAGRERRQVLGVGLREATGSPEGQAVL